MFKKYVLSELITTGITLPLFTAEHLLYPMHYLINLNDGMKSDTIITTMLQMRNLRLHKAKLPAYQRSDTVEHLLDAMHCLINVNNGRS